MAQCEHEQVRTNLMQAIKEEELEWLTNLEMLVENPRTYLEIRIFAKKEQGQEQEIMNKNKKSPTSPKVRDGQRRPGYPLSQRAIIIKGTAKRAQENNKRTR
ncbi:hypothetical protein J6590_044762 [Homalodisca vitripennis]|nr:hypothetical protein J6590_044762 [Homalodisca vitripennis]